MPLTADVLSPGDGDVLAAGPVEVSGYAFTGDQRTVSRVDVSVDGGATWMQAYVERATSPWSWQHWRLPLHLRPGSVQITARAWDSAGATQSEFPASVWNAKGYVNTSWARVRVTVH